jgi:hypothetical protein
VKATISPEQRQNQQLACKLSRIHIASRGLRRARLDRRGRSPRYQIHQTPSAGRNRNRPRRCGRSDRRGFRAGTSGRRRDAEPRGAAASARYTHQSGNCRQHAATDRRAVRSRRPRAVTACRLWRAATRLAGQGRKRRGKPVRGPALGRDAARRARGGSRAACPPLAAGE